MQTFSIPAEVSQSSEVKRRSSLSTAATLSDSSDDMSPHDKMNSSRKTLSKTSGRDVLVGLITKELMHSWKAEDEDTPVTTESSVPAPSAEEIFYAQMNGEALDTSMHKPPAARNPANDDDDDDGIDQDALDDACSFAALTLPVGPDHSDRSLRLSGNSAEYSNNEKPPRSSRSGNSSSEDSVSMEEIQKHIMNSMPANIRNKVPKHAWSKIFGKGRVDITPKPKNIHFVDEDNTDSQDDSSVVSDITSWSASRRQNCESPRAPGEVWDEELCPSLQRSSPSSSVAIETEMESPAISYKTIQDGAVTRTKKSGVSFSYVQVRYYERILDINPAVTSGAAIGIGWRFKRCRRISVDDWEAQRVDQASSNDLLLPRHVRESMLKEIGYTQKDLAEATRIIRKAKDRRKTTVANLGVEPMEAAIESATRRVRGILSFGKKKGILK